MSKRNVALTLLCWVGAQGASPHMRHCDVVVIGGGTGAHAAMFLKDNGYDVCLLEKTGLLGGHCNTINISEAPGWVDIGVVAWMNTTWVNENNLGNFTLDTAAYVSRFTTTNPIPALGIPPFFVADLKNGVGVNPAPAPVITNADLLTLASALDTMYPFYRNLEYPDVIPPELALSFKDYCDTHEFIQPYIPMITQLALQGGFKVEDTPTMYVFKELAIYMHASVHGGVLFSMTNGCASVFNAIQAELDSPQQSVFLNVNIQRVTRPAADHSNGVSTVRFTMNGQNHLFTAKHVFIAISPTLANLDFLNLNAAEEAAFANVIVHPGFYSMRLQANDATVPVVTNYNLNNTANFNEPLFPAVYQLYQGAAGGVFVGVALANETVPFETMVGVVFEDLTRLAALPNPVDATLVSMLEHENYFPRFTPTRLSQAPSPYRAIYDLQGLRNTYWIGAINPYPDTALISEYSFRLVSNNFPLRRVKKSSSRRNRDSELRL